MYVPLAEMGVGAAFLKEMLAVLPHCVAGTVMTAAWGKKGSAVLPVAGQWRSITGVTCYVGFGPLAEGGLSFTPQFSTAIPFELFLPFQ